MVYEKNPVIVMKEPHVFLTLIEARPWRLFNTEQDQTWPQYSFY